MQILNINQLKQVLNVNPRRFLNKRAQVLFR